MQHPPRLAFVLTSPHLQWPAMHCGHCGPCSSGKLFFWKAAPAWARAALSLPWPKNLVSNASWLPCMSCGCNHYLRQQQLRPLPKVLQSQLLLGGQCHQHLSSKAATCTAHPSASAQKPIPLPVIWLGCHSDVLAAVLDCLAAPLLQSTCQAQSLAVLARTATSWQPLCATTMEPCCRAASDLTHLCLCSGCIRVRPLLQGSV